MSCLAVCQKQASSLDRGMKGKAGGVKNILLITLDTVRQDRVGFYSTAFVKTPNIDGLAAKSLVFMRAFAHNPVTLPSHINILTGVTALYHGVSDNSGFKLDDRVLTVAEFLKAKSFDTGAFVGAFPLDSRFGLNQGFDVYDDNYGTHNTLELFFVERRAGDVIKPAINWISGRSAPWFCFIHLFDPHQPYAPPPPFDTEYADDLYSGEVAYVDQQLATLFSFLKEKKFLENTVVVITADHGEALGEKGELTHSYFAYNNTILVPLIIYIPGVSPLKIDTHVSHVDIFPTLCDILGDKPPAHLQGDSLLPLVDGKKKAKPEIYFESLTAYLNRGWAPLRGFIKDQVKFIDLPIKEVYDLGRDIGEEKNLAEKSNTKQLTRQLQDLQAKLRGAFKVERADRIDPDTQRNLRSLGYVTGSSGTKKEIFTPADDLKTLLPVQNKMLEALAKLEQGQPEAAIADLREVIKKSPGFVLVYNHLANIYQDLGRADQAIAVLREGLGKNPDNGNLLSRLGIVLAETGQSQEAIDILAKCTAREGFDPENFNYLGVAYFKSGNLQLALENYRQALSLDENYASAFNNIGSLYLVAYLRQKDEQVFQLAMENFDRAIAIDPNLAAAYNGRGAAFLYRNDTEKAIKDWLKAIEIKPDYFDPYFSIGITYLKAGNKEAARTHFRLFKEKLYNRLPATEQERLNRLMAEAGR